MRNDLPCILQKSTIVRIVFLQFLKQKKNIGLEKAYCYNSQDIQQWGRQS